MDDNKPYRVYWYRHVVLLIFSLAAIASGHAWTTFIPISGVIKKIYNVDYIWVNMMSLLYMAWYTPVSFLANYVLDKYGPRLGVSIGIVLTVIGTWVRCCIPYGYFLALLGQSFAAIGQPFILNAPAKVAAYWYSPEGRTLATTIASAANLLGCSIGFYIPSLFVNEESGEYDVEKLLVFEAIIASATAGVVIILLRNQPATPPCAAAGTEKIDYRKAFSTLFKNVDYIFLLISAGMLIGNFGAFSTILDQLLTPFGYTSSDSSLLGSIFMLVGVVGSVGIGKIVDLFKIYRITWVSLQFTCLVGIILLMLGLYYHVQYAFIFAIISVLGISMTTGTPLALDFACETTFPVGEAMCSGFIMSLAQIISIIEVLLVDNFKVNGREIGNALKSFYILGTASIVATFTATLIKESLKREKYERMSTISIR